LAGERPIGLPTPEFQFENRIGQGRLSTRSGLLPAAAIG
jgi:hypothetical protein